MSILKFKRTIVEVEGGKFTIAETGASKERAHFLKELLELNKYVVKLIAETKKDESAPDTFQVGVTDLAFNAILMIYSKKLKRNDGKIVTPAYWQQDFDNSNMAYYRVVKN